MCIFGHTYTLRCVHTPPTIHVSEDGGGCDRVLGMCKGDKLELVS